MRQPTEFLPVSATLPLDPVPVRPSGTNRARRCHRRRLRRENRSLADLARAGYDFSVEAVADAAMELEY